MPVLSSKPRTLASQPLWCKDLAARSRGRCVVMGCKIPKTGYWLEAVIKLCGFSLPLQLPTFLRKLVLLYMASKQMLCACCWTYCPQTWWSWKPRNALSGQCSALIWSYMILYALIYTLYILIQELLPKWDSKTVGTLSAPPSLAINRFPMTIFRWPYHLWTL